MKLIKKITVFKTGSMCVEMNKLIDTPGETEQFQKELEEACDADKTRTWQN